MKYEFKNIIFCQLLHLFKATSYQNCPDNPDSLLQAKKICLYSKDRIIGTRPSTHFSPVYPIIPINRSVILWTKQDYEQSFEA